MALSTDRNKKPRWIPRFLRVNLQDLVEEAQPDLSFNVFKQRFRKYLQEQGWSALERKRSVGTVGGIRRTPHDQLS